MDVCVVLIVRTVAWNVKSDMKDSTKMDQRGKTPGQEKKSHRGHGCLCCVCKDGNMERKVTWRTKGFKKYKNGSKGKKPGQAQNKNPTEGMDVCLLWVLCVVR
jgi:hypothetical protein